MAKRKIGDAGDHHPQPGVAGELAPAGREVADEAAAAGTAGRGLAACSGFFAGESAAGPGDRGGRLPPAAERRRPQPQQEPGAHEIRQSVDADAPAGADRRHEQAGQHRAQRDRHARHETAQPVGLLEPRAAHHLRREADRGRPEERLAHAHADLEQRQLPDLGHAGDEQSSRRALQPEAQEVRDQHHLLARQPVGPHAADEEEDGQRDQVGGFDDADVGGRAADLEHGEGQRDHGEHDAHDGGGLPEEQLAELGLTQGGDVVGQLGHPSILLAAAAGEHGEHP